MNRGPATHALALNAGSSSLKFGVYRRSSGGEWRSDARGQIGGIEALADWLRERDGAWTLLGVGHRVVHGGSKYVKPCVITPEVLANLEALVPLAPLHLPRNIAAIETVAAHLSDVPQVACFDTGFHRGQPAVAELIPLPKRIRETGVRRYGFHGLSYEYIASVLPDVAPEIAEGRLIAAHLGSGASLCAMKARRSVECTLGFTALDGLCMGTRPGSVDPGVILHLFQTMGLTASEVERILYEESGLLGISDVSSDMRDLEKSPEPGARMAMDYFVYQAVKHIGALAATLGGVDALIFTAGIGEHSATIRRRICEGCAWLGVTLDRAANDRHGPRISRPASPVAAWVIPTDEESLIARHMGELLGARGLGRGHPDGET
jgi:acetate kinase